MAVLSLFVSLLSLSTLIAAFPKPLNTRDNGSATDASSTPRLIMYVQTFHDENDSNDLSLLPLLDDNTGVTHVILAMLHLNTSPGDIHLNNDPPNSTSFDSAWSDVKTLQSNGIKVMGCLGGAGDGSYGHLADDFDSYYQPLLNNVIKPYALDGLDLDIESSTNISVPLQLINALYNDMGPDFLITLTPVASALQSPSGGDLSVFSYFDLDSQAVVSGTTTKLVSWYNAQFYSGFGDPSSPSDYESIINAGWDPSRVVMGVLDSANDGSGEVAVGTLESTIESLHSEYSTFGGVYGWEYFDAGSSDGDANPWQWVQQIGNALFNNTSSKMLRTRAPATFPPAPFPSKDLELLEASGATHFEAVRALNLTSGDVDAAANVYHAYQSR
ncbi:MAG: Cyclin-dependent kinase catalytic subunit [Claussenomyces sp. TS43310]|nr:MAG: Cyclin-dependent kinase catalytic subunit [Claussenomyces sp. TS43310]